MSNSRRGLLAAGLAVAVVGSMSIVWTLNADAAETPEIDTPAVVAAAPVADAAAPVAAAVAKRSIEPPPLLPWGAKPKKIKRAKAGASSEAIAAAGAGAAAADTSGSRVPRPVYAPKRRASVGGGHGSGGTAAVPPAPPSVRKAARADGPPFYHYVQGTQEGGTDGTWANLTIHKPKLATRDYHTLAELAVRSADEEQVVEVGWTVDRTVNKGSEDPHLFVYYWVNGVPRCYNCKFISKSDIKPGDTLPVGTQKRFGIERHEGGWWIAYDSEWLGYFEDAEWDGKFTRGGYVQWFGEVASSETEPCSEMGNALPALDPLSARIGSIDMTNGPKVKFEVKAASKYYTGDLRPNGTTFRYGGPGASC